MNIVTPLYATTSSVMPPRCMMTVRSAKTRGQRNHNPLNIRRSPRTRWLGQAREQYDREFVQFSCDLFGLRAAFRIIRTYIDLHDLHTLRHIIYRWAPPEDGNCTESYIATVSESSNVLPEYYLEYSDREQLIAIVAAMAYVESRMTFDHELLVKAYELAK